MILSSGIAMGRLDAKEEMISKLWAFVQTKFSNTSIIYIVIVKMDRIWTDSDSNHLSREIMVVIRRLDLIGRWWVYAFIGTDKWTYEPDIEGEDV